MASEVTKALFAGASTAKVYERGKFFSGDGSYTVKVEKTILKDMRGKGPGFIVEVEITASNNPEHPAGAKRTWIQKMLDKDIAFGALKVFSYAVLGLDMQRDAKKIATEVDPIIEGFLADLVEGNAAKGATVKLDTLTVTTKDGKPFTRHNWQPVA